jgi:hypothetical protein
MPFAPTRGQIHVDRLLTNITIGFLQDARAFVAPRVFQRVPVLKQSDRYAVYDRGFFFRNQMKKRAPGTEAARVHYAIDNTPTYYADVWALAKDIADQDRANYDQPLLGPDREASLFLGQQALLNQETEFVTNWFKTGVWTTEYTGVASSPSGPQFLQWNDAASNPIEDIRARKRAARELTGYELNILTLGRAVYDALLDHPDIIDRIKYGQTPGQPAMANEQILAQLFEVDEVNVMNGIQTTSNEGATNTFAFIGGKHAMLTYRPPAPGLFVPAAGYTFVWTGYQGSAGELGTEVSQYRMPELKSDRTEIEAAYDQKLVSADLGVFFASAVA